MRLLFLILMIVGVTGCANDSLTRCYQAQRAWGVTLNTVADLRDKGIIPQAKIVETKRYRDLATTALYAWEDAAKAKNTDGAKSAEQEFIDAAAFIQRLIDVFSPATTRPTTRTGVSHGRGRNSIRGDPGAYATGINRAYRESADYSRRVEWRSRSDCSRSAAA